jgi:hypothetical protein
MGSRSTRKNGRGRSKKCMGGRRQRFYNMKGCSKKNVTNKSNKYVKEYQPFIAYAGGGDDISRAYPTMGPAPGGYGFLPGSISRGGCGGCGMSGGKRRKITRRNKMGGGGSSFVGSAWTPDASTWPGVSGGTTGTHYPLNTYNNDVQLKLANIGAQPPYLGRGGGKGRRRRKQNGGGFMDSLTYGVNSAFDTLRGVPSTTPNPLPFKGQFPNNPSTIVV